MFFFIISLKKVWEFGYLVLFTRTDFREFAFPKNLVWIRFRKTPKIREIHENYFF